MILKIEYKNGRYTLINLTNISVNLQNKHISYKDSVGENGFINIDPNIQTIKLKVTTKWETIFVFEENT